MWVLGWSPGCIATDHMCQWNLLSFLLFKRIPAGYISYAHRYIMQMTDPNLINRVNTYDSPYFPGYHVSRSCHISILSTQNWCSRCLCFYLFTFYTIIFYIIENISLYVYKQLTIYMHMIFLYRFLCFNCCIPITLHIMFPALARHWVQGQVKVAMWVMSMPCAPGGGVRLTGWKAQPLKFVKMYCRCVGIVKRWLFILFLKC